MGAKSSALTKPILCPIGVSHEHLDAASLKYFKQHYNHYLHVLGLHRCEIGELKFLISENSEYALGHNLGRNEELRVDIGLCLKSDEVPSGEVVALKTGHVLNNAINTEKLIHECIEIRRQQLRDAPTGEEFNIVEYFEAIQNEKSQQLTLVLEYCSGNTLLSSLLKLNTYSESLAAFTIASIAKTLSSLHAIGIIHANLEPGNLVYQINKDISTRSEYNSAVKLIDFESACFAYDLEASRIRQGKHYYSSPEMFLNKPLTPASDMWSLGV